MYTEIILALGAMASNAYAGYANTTSTVDFVTGHYPEFVEVDPFPRCPNLNFEFKNYDGLDYPLGHGKIVQAYELGDNDYEVVFSFSAEGCPPLSNLDQCAIIGVDSPEASTYLLHDSNQDISLISNPCDWTAKFVVKGESVGKYICAPDFQIHYSWFSGRASSSDELNFHYQSAYEYLMSCVSDNRNDAQSDFSQYCWLADDTKVSSAAISSAAASSHVSASAVSIPTAPVKATTKSASLTKAASTVKSATESVSAAKSATSASSVADLYYQCGGKNWTGPTECVSGAICQSMNPFYYQCVASTTETYPETTSTSTTTSSTSSSSSSSFTESATTTATVADLYYQCGGKNWNGPTECVSGAICQSMNPFYYQCVAAPTISTTESSTSSTTESSTFSAKPSSVTSAKPSSPVFSRSSSIVKSGYYTNSTSTTLSPSLTLSSKPASSLLTVLTKATPSPTAFAELYGQCGGENWKGATACVNGAVCSSMNPFYFQCVAGPTTSTTSTTPTTTGPAPTVFAELYGQCGGENWKGATACATGECSSMNAFYYQCVQPYTAEY